jgi:hypothetical protein
LEIGIGPGLVAVYLTQKNIKVFTVDLEIKLKPQIVGSIINLPLQKGSFDTVLCCQVLVRIPNFVFWDFLIPFPWAVRKRIRYVRQHYWEIHRWGYSYRRVLKIIEREGFPLERIFRISEYPFHLFFIACLI